MPNGNDEWSQYKRAAGGAGTTAPAADEWDEFKRPGPTPASTKLEKSAAFDSSVPAKLGRGAVLGAAEGAGIVPTTDTSLSGGVEAQTAKQFGKGALRLVEDIGAPFVDPFLPEEKRMHPKYPALGPLGSDIASGLVEGGGEAWKGLKERDPEAFAHGLGSLVAQLAMLKGAGEKPTSSAPTLESRLAKTAAAIDVPTKYGRDLDRAMPDLVKRAQSGGVETVGEFGKLVKDSQQAADSRFNTGFATSRNVPVDASPIARRIRALKTSNMPRTVAGQSAVQYLENRALEYEKAGWTYGELNDERIEKREALAGTFNKDTRELSASPLDIQINKAIRDGASKIVYDKWSAMNPGEDAAALKRSQGSLWALNDYLNNPKKGLIEKLKVGQQKHQGRGIMDRIHARAAIHKGGVSAYMTSSLLAPFERGPMSAANAKIAEAFPGAHPSLFQHVQVAALPIGALVGRQTPFDQTTPPPPDTPDEDASE